MSFSRSDLKGDFLGFTFDGIHSSELGIVRVSDGSRYNENLLPTIQDKTIQRPGADGMYYYGSFYTQRQINISIAFDSLTEIQLRRLKVLFGDKKVHTLIFDELPYKIYKVKTTGTPNLKYLPFERPLEQYEQDQFEGVGNEYDNLYSLNIKTSRGRIYKGEGQLTFISYLPYARSRFKYINDYTGTNISEWYAYSSEDAPVYFNNKNDWAESSRLINSGFTATYSTTSYTIDKVEKSGVLCYNAGDLETSFKLKLFFPFGTEYGLTITRKKVNPANNELIEVAEEKVTNLALSGFNLEEGDSGICINSKLHLIEGIDADGKSTGKLYNQYIEFGDFFDIPVSLTKDEFYLIGFTWDKAPSLDDFNGQIDYDYLYY